MSEPSYTINLLNILGENVSLTPTDLAPSETSIVEFDRYYVPPDISGQEVLLLKNLMREVFQNKVKVLIDTDSGKESDMKDTAAFPPCGAAEKAMVLTSLLHRKNVLEQQLFNIGIKTPDELRSQLNEMNESGKDAPLQGRDSLLARTYLTHYLRLQQFINQYDSQQFCIHLEDIAYGDLQLNLTDKKVQELLRQFVFFVLQGHHPLQKFKKTDPTATAYLSRLTRKPLNDDLFKDFLTTYKGNKLPIPPAIAKILEISNLDPKSMADAIQTQLDKERDDLLEYVVSILPLGDPFWRRVSNKEDIRSVIDALVLYPKDLLQEIKRLEASIAATESKRAACEQARKLLEQQKNGMTRLIASLQTQLGDSEGKDEQIRLLQEQQEAAEEDFNRRIAEVIAQKDDCDRRVQLLNRHLASYIARNRELTQQIEELTNRNRELERIAREAETNLEGLRRTHEAQLAAERDARRVEAEARGRAEQALADAGRAAAAQVAELASVRTQLTAAGELSLAKDRDIAALRAQLQGKETEEGTLRGEIQAKTNQLRDVNDQLAAAQTSLGSAEEQLAALRRADSESKIAIDGKDEEIEELEARIAQLTTDIGNLRIQVKACEDEKTALRGKVSGTTADVAALSTRVKVAEEQKAAADEENRRLSARLGELESRVSDAEELTKEQKGLVREKTEIIEQKDDELQAQRNKLGEESRRADAAEAKVAEVEASKEALQASFATQLQSAESNLRTQFGEQLSGAKGEFERLLGEAKEGAAAEIAESKAALDSLREVVLAIASNEDITTLQPKMEALPEREALQSILQRLTTAVSLAAPGTTPPALMQCYFVFLTSFLWQSNFPTLLAKATKNPGYAREKLFYDVLTSIFLTGPEPRDGSGKMRLSGEQVGLYAKLKTEPRITDVTIMKDFFSILQTLARAIESNTEGPIDFSEKPVLKENASPAQRAKFSEQQAKYEQLQTKSLENIKALQAQLAQLTRVYDGKLLAPSSASSSYAERMQAAFADFNDDDGGGAGGSPTSIGTFAKSYMQAHQYDLPSKMFAKTIVIDGTNVKLGSTGDLNYAVLFYCFLVLMRDYLILIENTGAQCKLPSFLKT